MLGRVNPPKEGEYASLHSSVYTAGFVCFCVPVFFAFAHTGVTVWTGSLEGSGFRVHGFGFRVRYAKYVRIYCGSDFEARSPKL